MANETDKPTINPLEEPIESHKEKLADVGDVSSGKTRDQNGGRLDIVAAIKSAGQTETADELAQKMKELKEIRKSQQYKKEKDQVDQLEKNSLSSTSALTNEEQNKLIDYQERMRTNNAWGPGEFEEFGELEEKQKKVNKNLIEAVELTQQHYETIQKSTGEVTEMRDLKISDESFLGTLSDDVLKPDIPELEDMATKLSENPSYREIEDYHYEGIKLVQITFINRSATIKNHLIDSLISSNKNQSAEIGINLNLNKIDFSHLHGNMFFAEIKHYTEHEYKKHERENINGYKEKKDLLESHGMLHQPTFDDNGNKKTRAEILEDRFDKYSKEINDLYEARMRMIGHHDRQYHLQRKILKDKVKQLNNAWSERVARVTNDKTHEIVHSKFIKGIKKAKELFRKKGGPIEGPLIAYFNEFKDLTNVKPGDEIINAVRKFLILINFDKKRTIKPLFTITRAVVFAGFKNLKEESGESILQFQNKLKNWWIRHVNRPKIDQNKNMEQEVISPVINSEKGSYFTRSSIKGKSKETMQNINQTDAIAIFAREQLLATLPDKDRDEELDVLDGWTHTNMPIKPKYAQIIHKGDKFKKVIISHANLLDHKKYIVEFNKQFNDENNWIDSDLSEEQKNKAMSGLTTTQEALTRKFDLDDCTSADTSLVLLNESENDTDLNDIAQRNTQAWTHGSAIKNSLIMLIGKDGKLTGEMTKKGAHAITDGRVSTLYMKHSLKKALDYIKGDYRVDVEDIEKNITAEQDQIIKLNERLYELILKDNPENNDEIDSLNKQINEIKSINRNQIIEIIDLTDGSDKLDKENEAPLESFKINRSKYQDKIDKLFLFFKNEHAKGQEVDFSLDINGLTSAAMIMTLNTLKDLSGQKDQVEGMHVLERMVNKKEELKIGATLVDTLAPVPLQIDQEIQNDIRELKLLLENNGYPEKSLEYIAKKKNIPLNELRNRLQKAVLPFMFFDIERQQIKAGLPGSIQIMAEMAGDKLGDIYEFISRATKKKIGEKISKIPFSSELSSFVDNLKKAAYKQEFIKKTIDKIADKDVKDILIYLSRIVDKKIPDISSRSSLFSSLTPSRAKVKGENFDENSTENEITIEAFSTARDEVYEKGVAISSSSSGYGDKEELTIIIRQAEDFINLGLKEFKDEINLQDLVEENMKRIIFALEIYKTEYENQQNILNNAA